MENLVNPDFWQGKRVLLTGHTGFKGSWLALWLQDLGARVYGYALPPATTPNFYQVAQVEKGLAASTLADLADRNQLEQAVARSRPEIILHLAAQALVGEGYRDPVGTYATNVMGTVHLLEAARQSSELRVLVVITTDKCYENREWPWPYRENEALGGYDPYSSSKACAEILTAAWRRSYLSPQDIRVATARAGNVIGGGDWSPERLVPDILAAFAAGRPAILRRPRAVRPWQHVLEPLAGYLQLTESLWQHPEHARAWNFGPAEQDCLEVGQVADQLARAWGSKASWEAPPSDFPHEAGQLRLDAALAHQELGLHPRWNITNALNHTVAWHRAWLQGANMRAYSLEQINTYIS